MARKSSGTTKAQLDNAAREALSRLIDNYSNEQAVEWLQRKFSSFAPGLAAGMRAPAFANGNFRDYFADATLLGFIQSLPGESGENKPLIVASVRMRRALAERTSRIVQFEYAKSVVRAAFDNPPSGVEGLCSQGLFFFHDDDGNFRLSLVSCSIEGRRLVWTGTRRQSFFCRAGARCNTMRKRLGAKIPTFAALHEAFSVEALTKEFYTLLFQWYKWACADQTAVHFPNMAGDEKANLKMRQEAVIRLITRLLFVWFVRERGLVPGELFDPAWIAENLKDFNPESMDAKTGTSYYRSVLQNLFFATLNVPPDERRWCLEKGKGGGMVGDYNVTTRFRFQETFVNPDAFITLLSPVPFLNCSLFDCLDRKSESGNLAEDIYCDGFSRREDRQARLPNALFFGDDSGEAEHEGLLKILSAYDFTIDENAASDGDVALDPELLGKVFENLLGAFNPETEKEARKMTGSFYTPREIVDYMVEQSLRSYLRAKVPAARDDAKLDELFRRANAGEDDKGLPFSREERVALLEALYACRSLDPACGSGAFPMGMLHAMTRLLAVLDPSGLAIHERILRRHREDLERLRADETLERAEREKRTGDLEKMLAEQTANPDYARKLWIIENCIYGVDIQPIAAQISKLRFYISLLCDQPDPPDGTPLAEAFVALPNLESKFACANTLLPLPDVGGEFGGEFDFSVGRIPTLRAELNKIRHRIFHARGYATKRKYQDQEKAKRREIAVAVADSLTTPDAAVIARERANIARNRKLLESIAEPKWVRRSKVVQGDFFSDTTVQGELELVDANAEQRGQIKKCIAKSEKIIANEESKANRAAGNTDVERLASMVAKWDPYDQNASSDFFDPDWMFDVREGFDIVIGNPPYIKLETIKEDSRRYEQVGFETYSKRGDIYVLFTEKGFDLLAANGHLSYIMSNKWLQAEYGQPLRALFLMENLKWIVDFGDIQIFKGATTYPCIFLASNNQPFESIDCAYLPAYRPEASADEIAKWVKSIFAVGIAKWMKSIPHSALSDETWVLDFAARKLLSRLSGFCNPLKSFIAGEAYYGIKPGATQAFIIDGKTRHRILAEDPSSRDIIVPMLRGRDIKPYVATIGKVWLIGTHNGYGDIEAVNLSAYPGVKNWLTQFHSQLAKRSDQGITPYHLRDCAYWPIFKKPKIMYQKFQTEPCFIWDERGLYCNDSMWIIPTEKKWLVGLFNSRMGWWLISKFCTQIQNGYQLIWEYFGKIPIPSSPDPATVSRIENLVDGILAAKAANAVADTSKLEEAIDEEVYALYGLSQPEIDIVKGRRAATAPQEDAAAKSAPRRASGKAGGSRPPSTDDEDYLE